LAVLGKRASSKIGKHHILTPSGVSNGAHVAYINDLSDQYAISPQLTVCNPSQDASSSSCSRDRALFEFRQLAAELPGFRNMSLG
jgi:hypothetical protein